MSPLESLLLIGSSALLAAGALWIVARLLIAVLAHE